MRFQKKPSFSQTAVGVIGAVEKMSVTTNEQKDCIVIIQRWDYTHYLYQVMTMTVIMT